MVIVIFFFFHRDLVLHLDKIHVTISSVQSVDNWCWKPEQRKHPPGQNNDSYTRPGGFQMTSSKRRIHTAGSMNDPFQRRQYMQPTISLSWIVALISNIFYFNYIWRKKFHLLCVSSWQRGSLSLLWSDFPLEVWRAASLEEEMVDSQWYQCCCWWSVWAQCFIEPNKAGNILPLKYSRLFPDCGCELQLFFFSLFITPPLWVNRFITTKKADITGFTTLMYSLKTC